MYKCFVEKCFFFKIFKKFILFLERRKGRQGEGEGEKHQCVVASPIPPNWGPGLQPRHVP